MPTLGERLTEIKVRSVIAAADNTAREMERRDLVAIPVIAGDADNLPIMQFLFDEIKLRSEGKLMLVGTGVLKAGRIIGSLVSMGVGAGATLLIQKVTD